MDIMGESEAENVFFYWNLRNGDITISVELFGSWNEFERPILLEYNGNTLYGGSVKLNKGCYRYYFVVDGVRTVDYTLPMITSISDEYNCVSVPLNPSIKENNQLFIDMMPHSEFKFRENKKRTENDLITLDDITKEMYTKMSGLNGVQKQKMRNKIRLRLLNLLGPLPYMSLEENIVEFRRNVTVLRMKMNDMKEEYQEKLDGMKNEYDVYKQNSSAELKQEREKWRLIVSQLKIENDSLRNGISLPRMTGIDSFMTFDSRDNDKNDKILAQQKKINALQAQINELNKKQNNDNTGKSVINNELMKDNVKELKGKLGNIKQEYSELKEFMKTKMNEMNSIKKISDNIGDVLKKVNYNMANMTNKYKQAMQLKRKYFNEIQDLKGNIRVFCRSRPILKIDKCQENIVDVKSNEMIMIKDIKNNKDKQYIFDRVYKFDDKQETVYKDVKPYIESVMDGYNVCIFAYGQTGSGKTFTMQGNAENPGINIRSLQHLFNIKEERYPDIKYDITVSMIEIYNEKIKDLLVSNDKAKNTTYKIRQNMNKEIYIENLSKHSVNNEDDVMKLMNNGRKNRSVTKTNSNNESSRSHMILTINVVGINKIAQMTYISKLHLIDLAGSERINKSGVTGQGLKEAQNINKSLSCLGDVMFGLSKKTKHIPYRNSTLTHMLQDSLGGRSKTIMFVNISPASIHSNETINALNFAERANKIELGAVKKGVYYNKHNDDSKEIKKGNNKKSSGVHRTSNVTSRNSRKTSRISGGIKRTKK